MSALRRVLRWLMPGPLPGQRWMVDSLGEVVVTARPLGIVPFTWEVAYEYERRLFIAGRLSFMANATPSQAVAWDKAIGMTKDVH